MRTICTPAYANMSMAKFELKYIYPYIKNKTKMFLRFIDDLFMIRTGSEQELLDFMNDLNKKILRSNSNLSTYKTLTSSAYKPKSS